MLGHGEDKPSCRVPIGHYPGAVFMYVSWHHFNQKQGGTPNGFWRALSAQCTRSFAETVRKAVTLGTTITGADLYSTPFRNLAADGFDSDRSRSYICLYRYA
jgi:hypothetical protein